MGDGALIEFASVVAAIACALAIQEATARPSRTASTPSACAIASASISATSSSTATTSTATASTSPRACRPSRRAGGIAVSRTVRDQVAGRQRRRVRRPGRAHGQEHRAPGPRLSPSQRPRNATGCRDRTAAPGRVRAAVRQHERRSGAGVLLSDGVSEDIITDSEQGLGAVRHRAQHRLRLQRPHVDVPPGRAATGSQLTCSKAASARPATACASPRS